MPITLCLAPVPRVDRGDPGVECLVCQVYDRGFHHTEAHIISMSDVLGEWHS
jgi:hypothetical protein